MLHIQSLNCTKLQAVDIHKLCAFVTSILFCLRVASQISYCCATCLSVFH